VRSQAGRRFETFCRLFEAIVERIPAPSGDPAAILQLQVIIWTIASFWPHRDCRVFNGTLLRGSEVGISKLDGKMVATKITKLFTFRVWTATKDQVVAGDIVPSPASKEFRSAKASPTC